MQIISTFTCHFDVNSFSAGKGNGPFSLLQKLNPGVTTGMGKAKFSTYQNKKAVKPPMLQVNPFSLKMS